MSGFEKAVMIECFIARVSAWLLFLALPVVIVGALLGYIHAGPWHVAASVVVIVVAAAMCARCEDIAESKLHLIRDENHHRSLITGK